MLRLTDEARIAAAPAVVFGVMTDLAGYREWNPWLVRAAGEIAEGKLIDVTVTMGRRRMKVQHRVLTCRPDRELRWCDVGWFTRIADGQRGRWLEPDGDGAVYRVELLIGGFGAGLVKAMYGDALDAGLRAETAALKLRAEAIARA